MTASVLGKRSRRAIDISDNTPEILIPRKRTRRAPLSIFEDKAEIHGIRRGAANEEQTQSRQSTNRPARSTPRQSTRSKHVDNITQSKDEVLCQMQEVGDLMDIENVPPTEFKTPTTIRHIDFLNVKLPSTPRHRVKLPGIPLTPRSSQKVQSAVRERNCFSTARQLFTQSSNPTKLVGREVEKQQIHQFISDSIEARRGGCTYVSGPPGTGKSALVQEVFGEFEQSESVQISVINCVSLRTANDIFSKLLQDFSSEKSVGKTNLKHHLSKLFLHKSNAPLRLVLLDEIDNLLDTDCDVLHTIFEWAMHKSSSMILVGIANALDLTDRFLPRLKAQGLKPNVLPFLPYTATQISTIISDKLRSLLSEDSNVSKDFVPFMQNAAIQLCGKKIASQTGDLRKAFSLVRRIIDQVEKETINKNSSLSPSKKALTEISNMASLPPTPSSSPSKSDCESVIVYTPENAPRATIAHAAKMASSIFNNGTLSRLSGLNLQQKAVLCSLVSREKRKAERNPYITPSKSANKIPTVKDLFNKYSMLCSRDEGLLQPLKDTEFRDVVASLETLGLIQETRGRTSSILTPTSTPSRVGRAADDKLVVSAVSEKEMRDSLNGPGADLLRRLLDNED